MARRPLTEPPRAFLFFGAFTGFPALFDEIRARIITRFGPLHPRGESAILDFPETETYLASMGNRLSRRFWVIAERWPQDGLAAVKRAAIALEDEIRAGAGAGCGVERPVNIDPGLINDCRIILATTKDYAHRIYRGSGIWEEITLVWRGGGYEALPWTYRDFKNPSYHAFFAPFRDEILGSRQEPVEE